MELFDIHLYDFSHQCNLLDYVERVNIKSSSCFHQANLGNPRFSTVMKVSAHSLLTELLDNIYSERNANTDPKKRNFQENLKLVWMKCMINLSKRYMMK